MTNQLKQLFLLPSLLLANAYLLIGIGEISTPAETTTYSETIKTTEDSPIEQVSPIASDNSLIEQDEVSTKEIILNSYSLATAIFLSVFSLSFYYVNFKKTTKFIFKIKAFFFIRKSKLILKKQSLVFNIIKAFQTSFHCLYFKLFSSLVHS